MSTDIGEARLKKYFIFLILISTGIYIVLNILPYLWADLYADEVLELLVWNGYGSFWGADAHLYLPLIYAPVYLASRVGLIFFWRWARVLFLALVVSAPILSGFLGILVQTAIESALAYAVALSDGAILILAYFSKLSSRYK